MPHDKPEVPLCTVHWTFRIEAAPGAGLMDVPVWGSSLEFKGTPGEPTDEDKRRVAELVTRQFGETLCRELDLPDPIKIERWS